MDRTLDAAKSYLQTALKSMEDGVAAVNDGTENGVTAGLRGMNDLQNVVMSFLKGYDVAKVEKGTDEILVAFYVATIKAETAAHNIQHHGSNAVIQLKNLCFVISAMGDNQQSIRDLALKELDEGVKPEMMNLPKSIIDDLKQVEKAYMDVCTLAQRAIEEIGEETPDNKRKRKLLAVLLGSAFAGALIVGVICVPGGAMAVTTLTAKTAVTAKITAGSAAVAKTFTAGKVAFLTKTAATSAKVLAANQSAMIASTHASMTAAKATAAIHAALKTSFLATGAAGASVFATTSIAHEMYGPLKERLREMTENPTAWMNEAMIGANGIIFELKEVQNKVVEAQLKLREMSRTTGNAQRTNLYLKALEEENFKKLVHKQLDDLRRLDETCIDLIDSVNNTYKYFKTKGNSRVLNKMLEGV